MSMREIKGQCAQIEETRSQIERERRLLTRDLVVVLCLVLAGLAALLILPWLVEPMASLLN